MKKLKIYKEDGVAIVQFAVLLPIMILVLAMVVDIGGAVHAKVNVQHLASEVQKATYLSEQGGASGGLYGPEQGDYLRERIIEENKTLKKDNLKVTIKRTDPETRKFVYHHYVTGVTGSHGYYYKKLNEDKRQYITTNIVYEHPYRIVLTKKLFGDTITLSESFTSMMHIEGDGDR